MRFFGWNEEDELENQMVKKLFDDIDSDGGGSLDNEPEPGPERVVCLLIR